MSPLAYKLRNRFTVKIMLTNLNNFLWPCIKNFRKTVVNNKLYELICDFITPHSLALLSHVTLIQRTAQKLSLCSLLRPLDGCEVLLWVCFFVCPSVCLSAHTTRKPHGRTSPNFCAWYLWPWLGHPFAALQWVMYFRFCGWSHFPHNGPMALHV